MVLPRPPSPEPAPQPQSPASDEPDFGNRDRAVLGALLRQRQVLAVGRLNPALASSVTAQLLLLAQDAEDPITLHLSAAEGDLDACLALADTIQTLPAPVHVPVRGIVGGPSVAVLAAAADRAGSPNLTVVLSLPTGAVDGTATRIAVQAESFERYSTLMRDLVASATGQAAANVDADLRAGRVLSAEDALAYGLLQRPG